MSELESGPTAEGPSILQLSLQRQLLDNDARGRSIWRSVVEMCRWPAEHTGLLICDVWDRHWSRGATERVENMVGRMDAVARAARHLGLQIVHAPSGTMDFYANSPARKRALMAPFVEPPPPAEREDPPLPVDARDHGSDTGETETNRAWGRQHAGIEIDDERDVVTDDGQEVYNLLATAGIHRLLIMGVHTNMCVLNRSFAIKQMVRWGFEVALIRDLTDAMYNPSSPPYVSHEAGTQLVIEYIEKFWCPTLLSENLLSVSC